MATTRERGEWTGGLIERTGQLIERAGALHRRTATRG
jgi:hypothetical protein